MSFRRTSSQKWTAGAIKNALQGCQGDGRAAAPATGQAAGRCSSAGRGGSMLCAPLRGQRGNRGDALLRAAPSSVNALCRPCVRFPKGGSPFSYRFSNPLENRGPLYHSGGVVGRTMAPQGRHVLILEPVAVSPHTANGLCGAAEGHSPWGFPALCSRAQSDHTSLQVDLPG